jgi:hypothetical protein
MHDHRPHPVPRPAADEHAPYYGRYIEQVPGADARAALAAQIEATLEALAPLDEARALHRYAPGKWSVKQVVGHLSDAERVFAYRALRIGRGDATPLPGFDENVYAASGGFDARPLAALLDELRVVRAGTLALFAGFEPAALERRGTANGTPVSVRALAWIVAGHERHHLGVLHERYGVGR